jgi:membrane protein DedA with SNARE-associated domain
MIAVFEWPAGLPAWLVVTVVVLLPALEASTFLGLVVPGETNVIVGGAVAHAGGLPLWVVMVAAGVGAVAVVLGRWTAAFRVLVPGIAGMSQMRRRTFTVANVIWGVVWAVLVAGGGHLAGASYRVLEQRLGLASGLLLASFIGAMIIAVVVYHRRRRGLAGR